MTIFRNSQARFSKSTEFLALSMPNDVFHNPSLQSGPPASTIKESTRQLLMRFAAWSTESRTAHRWPPNSSLLKFTRSKNGKPCRLCWFVENSTIFSWFSGDGVGRKAHNFWRYWSWPAEPELSKNKALEAKFRNSNCFQVLETCVKRCTSHFLPEIGKFRFLNELIKLVSPKYLGAHTPESVRRRVLELMYSWTLFYPKEAKIKEAYEMLKKQGVVKVSARNLWNRYSSFLCCFLWLQNIGKKYLVFSFHKWRISLGGAGSPSAERAPTAETSSVDIARWRKVGFTAKTVAEQESARSPSCESTY